MPALSSNDLDDLLLTSQSLTLNTWMDLLHHPALFQGWPKKSHKSLISALHHLDVPAVVTMLTPLLNKPESLTAAFKPIKVTRTKNVKGKWEVITPLSAVLHPFKPVKDSDPSQERTQAVLLGLLLAVGAPIHDQDWRWAVTAQHPVSLYVEGSRPPPAHFLQRLLNHGTPIPVTPFEGATLLFKVARFPHHWPDSNVQALIDAGIPVNHVSHYGTNAVHAAAGGETSQHTIVGEGALVLLLQAGGDPHLASQSGARPIHLAALQPTDEALNLLVTHGADPLSVQIDDSDDPLDFGILSSGHRLMPIHQAAQNNTNGAVIDALLVHGVSVDLPDELDGNTALHWAMFYRNQPMVEHLLERGADLDITNKKGLTPRSILETRPEETNGIGMGSMEEEIEEDLFQAKTTSLENLLIYEEVKRLLRASSEPVLLTKRSRTRL